MADDEVHRAAKAGFQIGWNTAIAHVARMLPPDQKYVQLLAVSTSATSEAFAPIINEHFAELGESVKRRYGLS